MPNSNDYSMPQMETYGNQQIVRASAVLPAAGAWDANVITIPTFDVVALLLTYTRGAAGGAFDIMVEGSLDGVTYFQSSVYAGGGVVAGADTTSLFQREIYQYESTGAAAERIVLGPIGISGVFDNLRVSARESGVVGNPGTLEIIAVLK